ncbi:portal protein [Synechococcus phage S-CRES3]|nr:portal protein [Synechococcus phage S-CRES3]
MHGINHPINDPSLVSYHRPELVRLLPQLEQAYDCWTLLNAGGLGAAKDKYLPKEPAEPAGAYKARLDRATYAPIYRDSIRSYAGLLSRFNLIDSPRSLEDNVANVDLQGSSLASFLTVADEHALRDGGTFVMVDMMPESGADNFFDQMNDGRHPYFISIDRADVINWQVKYDRGIESIQQVTVRQLRAMPDPEGKYGNVVEPIYYVLKPGTVEMYRLVKSDASRWENQLIDTVETSLPIVPIVWYGATTSRFAQGDLPMDGLADLSIQHFQMRSDLCELLHKCAMPVPVRKGAPIGPDGKPAPLILGPNTAVDLSGEGGSDFSFAEPTGKSLERHQQEIVHVEALMDRSSLNFLYGANVKTATEASLRASQVSSSVNALIRNKTAAFSMLMRLWAWYAGEQSQITPESGLAMNDSLMTKPLEASEMAQLVNLYSSGLLSKKTVLDELQRGGVLDPDLVVEDEMSRIEEDKEEKMADAQAMTEATTPETPEPKPVSEETQAEQKAAEEAK